MTLPARSARMLLSASLCVAGLLLAGCTAMTTTEQRALAPEPELTTAFTEPATQPVRDYDQSAALYQSGDIASGTTGARYRTKDTIHPALVPVAETGVFIANVVTSPVTAYEQREGIVSTGPQFPPTHTAMPPLPASQAQVQEMLPSAPSTQPTEVTITRPDADPTVVTTSAGLIPAAELSTSAFAVVGHIQFPGRYEARENLTLAQAIVAAGLVEKDGSKVTVKIERPGEEPSTALLSEILSGQTANPTLIPGDVVTVTVQE